MVMWRKADDHFGVGKAGQKPAKSKANPLLTA
jgi:hypothetical protein